MRRQSLKMAFVGGAIALVVLFGIDMATSGIETINGPIDQTGALPVNPRLMISNRLDWTNIHKRLDWRMKPGQINSCLTMKRLARSQSSASLMPSMGEARQNCGSGKPSNMLHRWIPMSACPAFRI